MTSGKMTKTTLAMVILGLVAVAPAAAQQTKTSKPAKAPAPATPAFAPHRFLVTAQLGVNNERFEVDCARNNKHEENVKCADGMIHDLQQAWDHLSLDEVPLIPAFEAPGHF